MRISDWSSDVCSSDLHHVRGARFQGRDVVAGRALSDPQPRRIVHLTGRAQHDHQALDRARRGADDGGMVPVDLGRAICGGHRRAGRERSEEPTSVLQSLMRNTYAVFYLTTKHMTIRYNN